jgi:hypothetical protein
MKAGTRPEHERGQTIPIWTLAIFTGLTLMFFSLNYASTLREQVRTQSAADATATAMLSVQATQWNKITAILYAADIEEWRIRSIMQAMIDAGNYNGGCTSSNTGSCLKIYQALRLQYNKAVNRYTADVFALSNFSWDTETYISGDAYKAMYNVRYTGCNTAPYRASCEFNIHVIDYSQRTPALQVGKDAYDFHVGDGATSSHDSTPVTAWLPARVEIAACETVAPIVGVSLFGAAPQATQIVARAAATLAPVTTEWLTPGVTINPQTGTWFAPTENYDSADDTFDATASPRDWYETTYPSQEYHAEPGTSPVGYFKDNSDNTQGTSFIDTSDLEMRMAWWSVIPVAPYSGTTSTPATLCKQEGT